MSVAEGAPELLSQVKEQIIAASRKELTNPLFGGATRKAAGSAVLVQASSNGLKDGQIGKRFSDRYSFPRRLESPRWPREPIVNVYKSLLEWVRFACSLKEDSEDQNADSVQVKNNRIDFNTAKYQLIPEITLTTLLLRIATRFHRTT